MVPIPQAWLRAALPLLLAAPVAAADARDPAALARLRHCGRETCLQIEGRRADPHAPVRVAGREVAASGRHSFKVSLPLSTVRDWSAPYARTIMVSVGQAGVGQSVRLPIGLLGHVTELAALEVRAP